MRKLKYFTSLLFFILTHLIFAQSEEKQLIRVEKMDYVYYPFIAESIDGSQSMANRRVLLASDTVVANRIQESIRLAINNRWNATLLEPNLVVDEIDMVFRTGKFKTKLKNKIPGNWHLFFQVYDNGPYPITDEKKSFLSNMFYPNQTFESLDYKPYNLRFKALIIDGSTGSEVFSHEMLLELQRTAVPDGQILLRRLPALTESFLEAIDKAVNVFFSSNPPQKLTLNVTPACLFLDVDKTLEGAQKLNFVTQNDSIIELLQLKQKWTVNNFQNKKTKRVNHFGDNLFNSSLTLFTGISTDKIREKAYEANLGFVDMTDNSKYFCSIAYTIETREEKFRESFRDSDGQKSYSNYLSGNQYSSIILDPNKKIYIIREKDTIGSLKIRTKNQFEKTKHFSQSWDGTNESSLSPIPENWNNAYADPNIHPSYYILEGELATIPFVIEKSKEGNQLDIEIKNQEVATFKIYNNLAVTGLLYSNSIDEKIFEVLIMLSSLPFYMIF